MGSGVLACWLEVGGWKVEVEGWEEEEAEEKSAEQRRRPDDGNCASPKSATTTEAAALFLSEAVDRVDRGRPGGLPVFRNRRKELAAQPNSTRVRSTFYTLTDRDRDSDTETDRHRHNHRPSPRRRRMGATIDLTAVY